ncbi:prepilin-type N-terminal cleavage/methylation domain-containing protein [Orenia metallireducens]|uniref:Prepilin-type N-terminal cleavage/methylation domain-containing protein n=1 Tax=Orenia metallireducens TaxID=1413210 RepID=A0A285F2Q0_9FIRM|nr:type II secretion system protein [Orenia metallireducens]PRX34778.1 prepilin-type N-terminal cleavage/methylation domain-containing protein [Orenia metallireducens]SNY05590.1 prepilin-type N-terminal cleavage/methylation domain-containing protein [Orenia metallireducens]
MFKSQGGFSLIEVLIALVVLGIIVSGLLDFWAINDRLVERTGARLQALSLAKMSIESFKAELIESDRSKPFVKRLQQIKLKEVEEEERNFKKWYPQLTFKREITFEENDASSYWVIVKVAWDNRNLELRRLFAER